MELKQIITHNLGAYTEQLVEAISQGFKMSGNIEHYPVQIAHMFYATLVREEVQQPQEEIKKPGRKAKVGEDAA